MAVLSSWKVEDRYHDCRIWLDDCEEVSRGESAVVLIGFLCAKYSETDSGGGE